MSDKKDAKPNMTTYGFGIDSKERDALVALCPKKFDMSAADYMRIIVRAIIDDRLTIAKPDDKSEVYQS